MPRARRSCKWPKQPDGSVDHDLPKCEMTAITRGYCRRHYDELRKSGKLEMGTEMAGRPAGKMLATPVPAEWFEGPSVSWAELGDLVRKRMKHIILDEGAGVAEVNKVIQVVGTRDENAQDPEKLAELKNIMRQTRGLKAVDE